MTDDLSAEELERQRRARLVGETRADVARWKSEKKNREKLREEIEHLPPPEVARRLIPAASEDRLEKWRREMDAIAEAHAAEAAELTTRSASPDLVYKTRENAAVDETRAGDWSAWNAWADGRIAEALDRERDALAEGFGEAIAKMLADERDATMRAMRDEIGSLKIEIVKLGSESAALREALAVDRSKPVDLPSPLSSRRVVN